MLAIRAVLSPVDRADLPPCRNAAAAQPAQGIGQKTHRNPKHVQILVLILGSIFGPQNGPRVGRLIKNPIKARIRGPFLGPFLGPKIGTRNRPKNADEFSQKLGKTLTRRDPGIQPKKKRSAEASQRYLDPTASLTPLLITCKELLQPALVVCM